MSGQLDFAITANNVGFTAGTASAQHSLHNLEQGVKGTRASMHAMEQVFLVFGSEIAPQITGKVMMLTTGMHSLRAVAIATGASFTMIGAGALGVIGILATLTAAVEYAHAKMQEGETGSNLVESLVQNREKVLARIQKLYGLGKLSKTEALNLQVKLALAPDSEAELGAAMKAVIARLREVQGPHVNLKALSDMNEIAARVRADGLTGPARVTAETDIAVADFTNKIAALGKATGYTDKEISDLTNTFAGQARDKFEKQFGPGEDKASKAMPPASLTSWEKIGAVFRNGSGGLDPNRETAVNTRLMHNELKITNRLLGEKGTTAVLRE